jgi:hypothetical protein
VHLPKAQKAKPNAIEITGPSPHYSRRFVAKESERVFLVKRISIRHNHSVLRFTIHERRVSRKHFGSAIAAEVLMDHAG